MFGGTINTPLSNWLIHRTWTFVVCCFQCCFFNTSSHILLFLHLFLCSVDTRDTSHRQHNWAKSSSNNSNNKDDLFPLFFHAQRLERRSNNNWGYKFEYLNDNPNQFVSPLTQHWFFLLALQETIGNTDCIQITPIFVSFLVWLYGK